jgi:uncharacterized membrane protein YdbT with pleckstrin-like domain
MGSYVNSHLDPDERVVYEARIHWIVYLGSMFPLGAGLVLAIPGSNYVTPWGGLALILVGVIGLVGAYIRSVTSEFAVTNRRVIVKTGFLSRRTIELNMSKVESIQVEQGIFARLLNYGTITVVGTGGTHEPFSLIDDPLAFRHAVQREQG